MKRNKILPITILTALLLTNGVWGAAPWVPRNGNWDLVTTLPPGLPNDADFKRGLLNVKKYDPPGSVGKAMGNNSSNDTAALQAALYASYKYNLVCYFPTGTYMVTDTLECDQAVDNNRRYTFQVLGQKGSPVSKRPVIRLKNGSGGFGDTSNRKPVLKIWGKEVLTGAKDVPGAEKSPDCFNNNVRGIDIWTGSNAGAAGMYFAGAQGCSVEDVRIDATGGYCGFLKTVGVNGGYYNVEVKGGRYGLFMQPHDDTAYRLYVRDHKPSTFKPRTRSVTDMFPIFTGCRFYNQTTRAIYTKGRSPTTFVGCHFKKTNAPIFETLPTSKGQGGNFTFMDCVIELTNNGLAIDNDKSGQGRSIYIKDVYFKNASQIIKNPSNTVTGTSNGWTRVVEYGRTLTAGTKVGENLIDGVKAANTPELATNTIQKNVSASSVPSANAVIANHIWDEASFPAFDDPGVYDVVTQGGVQNDWSVDVTTKLQNILNNPAHTKIFIPKGLYKIKKTLTLPGNKQLFGICRTISVFRPNHAGWNYSVNSSTEDYILTTDTGKDDAPLLSGIWFDFTHLNPGRMLSVLHWRAGRNSMVRNIFAWDEKWGGLIPGTSFSGLNKKLFRFSGNAGGRMYGITTSWQHTGNSSAHDGWRAIYVTGTREPLNFYGYNVERQIGKYQSEFNNAHNVNVFGCKTEGENIKSHTVNREDDRPMLGIVNCNNIIVGTAATSKIGCKDGWVHIRNSTNILCANITTQDQMGSLNLIEEFLPGNNSTTNPSHYVRANKNVMGVFKRGNATLNDFDGTTPPEPTSDNIELESLTESAQTAGIANSVVSNSEATGGKYVKFEATNSGQFISYNINVPSAGTYRIYTGIRATTAAGKFQLKVSGSNVGAIQDLYSAAWVFEERDIGTRTFSSAGNKEFRFEVTGRNASSTTHFLNLDYLKLELESGANTQPDIAAIADVVMNEGTTTVVNINATDPDGDTITLTAPALPTFGNLTVTGNGTATITFSPGSTDAGVYPDVLVKADDGNGGLRFKQFDLTVNNVNTQPNLDPIADVTMNEGATISVNVSGSDPDGDPLILTAYNYPTFTSFVDNGNGTGVISFSPGNSDAGGPILITVKADDGNGGTRFKQFNLTVNNVNAQPDLDPIADVIMDEGTTTTVNISASDPDGDSIILTAYNYPVFTTFSDNGNGTGTISFAPGSSDAGGPTLITIKADDGNGGTRFKQFNLTVNNSVNSQPNLDPIADVTMDEGENASVNISGSDPDGDPLILTAYNYPTFTTFVDNGDGTGVISFAPGYADHGGPTLITIKADDSNGGTRFKQFNLTVNNVNSTPNLTVNPTSVTVDENQTAIVSITATDGDGDPITLSATNMPNFGTLTDNGDGSGEAIFSPNYTHDGIYTISLSADDGAGGVHNIPLTVTVNNINRQPAISTIAAMTIEEECVHVVHINATDSDTDDTLTFSESGLPSFGNLTDNGDGTCTIVLSPASGDAGEYNGITITVNDGNTSLNTDSTSCNLTVEAIPGEVYYTNDFTSGTVSPDFTGNATASFTISGGELVTTDPTAYKTIFLNTTDAPTDADNFKIVSRMKKGAADGYKGSAIRFRHDSSTDYYELQLRTNDAEDIRIYARESGVNNGEGYTKASWDLDMNPEIYANYSLVVAGTDLKVYKGNTLIGNTVLNHLTGRIGLTSRASESFWDYFRVIPFGAPDYSEDFDDAMAQDWSYDATKFELSDTGNSDYVLKQPAGVGFNIASYNKVVSVDTNYSVYVDGRVVGTRVKNWDSPNLVLKYKDPDNYISIYINQNTVSGACSIRLKKVIGSQSIADNLNTATTALSSVSEWHRIAARVNGDKLSIFINGEEVTTDYTVTELNASIFDGSTQCGVRYSTPNVSAEFDNFEFYDEYSDFGN